MVGPVLGSIPKLVIEQVANTYADYSQKHSFCQVVSLCSEESGSLGAQSGYLGATFPSALTPCRCGGNVVGGVCDRNSEMRTAGNLGPVPCPLSYAAGTTLLRISGVREGECKHQSQ